MKKVIGLMMVMVSSITANSADWDNIPVPADAGTGMVWSLQSLSDDFNYEAPASGKSDEFNSRWDEGFINAWTGPGMTLYTGDNASVSNGMLLLKASRKEGTENVFTGAIHSKESVQYPLYIEAKVKITNLTLANAFWLLSSDSTQEIDVIESYGSDRAGQEWFDQRMHLSHHVFVRDPFQDYQPKDSGSWVTNEVGTWRNKFYRIGVYWIDPWHLEYYIDGKLVRTVTDKNMIDPEDYTNGSGLSKPMQVILDVEQQDWREAAGIKATDEELADPEKNTFYIDWVRFYKPVKEETVVDTSAWAEGNTTTVEFGDFVNTDKDGAAFPSDTELGFHKVDNNINYNTTGDWGEYDVDFAEAGYYRVNYIVASESTDGLGIKLFIDGALNLDDSFSGTGGWDNFQTISASKVLYIDTAGPKVVRVQSSGSSEWQWNGDNFFFTKLIDPTQNTTPDTTTPDTTTPDTTTPDTTTPDTTTPDTTTPENKAESKSSGGAVAFIWLALLLCVTRKWYQQHEN